MGYELEARALRATPRHAGRVGDLDTRCAELTRRLQRADERIAGATIAVTGLRGRVAADDPAWIAAQLRLAEARLRRRELATEIEHLEDEFETDVWR